MKVLFHGYSFHPLKQPPLQMALPRRHFNQRPGGILERFMATLWRLPPAKFLTPGLHGG
jgi:hypothetical protein